ncbi:hypothetical protein SAMN05720759_105203 [Fibrobacter sp. UWB12]|nr:hypothetical protein SAMN05720759_105203 [Fibrobacter sp. UWB12]
MKMIRLILIICLGIILTSCSDDKSTTSAIHYIEGNENIESRSLTLEGSFSLSAKIIPVDIDIDVIDQNLDSIATVKAKLERERNGNIVFKTDYQEYTSPIVRIKYTCLYNDSASKLKIDLVEYVDIDNNAKPVLNLPIALGSNRVKYLVQEDGFYLARAKEKALREIFELLDYSKKQNIDFEKNENAQALTELNRHLNALTVVDLNDSAFYRNFNSLRSAVGSGKTWRDVLSESEIADVTFSKDMNELYSDLWEKSFGLSKCDSANYKKTVKISNKNSIYNNKTFFCDYENKKYKWRLEDDFEVTNGVCTADRKDTVIHNNVVYICNTEKKTWNVMLGNEALPYMNAVCNRIYEGFFVDYNSTNFACVYENGKYLWSDKVTEDYKWRNSIDVYVKNKVGLCDGDNNLGKSTILNNKYYMCRDSVWKEVDKFTYYLGDCDRSRKDIKAMHDSLGYYICNEKWVEIPIPQYNGDICTKGYTKYIKKYDDIYYICREGSSYYWDVATEKEIPIPVKNGHFCEKENNGEVVEIDSVGYRCIFPLWKGTEDCELITHRAIERNKYPKDYCKNGINGTSLFWDKVESLYFGCVDEYTAANFGWGRVVWEDINNFFIKIDNPEKITGGTHENNFYVVEVDGWKLYFDSQNSRMNGSVSVHYLELIKVISPKGEPYEVRERNGRTSLRAAEVPGDSTIPLDSIKNKSDSFDKYFANWKNKIKESTKCPDPTLLGFQCVSNWEESDIEIKFDYYNEKSYMTLDQAKAFCPEGSRIPSAEELSLNIYPNAFSHERSTFVQQKLENGTNGKFAAKYMLVWTSTEKDADTQYCLEYVKNTRDNNIVASGIVECPKDLYPMVQAFCINDERNP